MDNIFAKYINARGIKLKYAKGMRDVYENEIHPFHEIFYYLSGVTEFIDIHGKTTLESHTLVVIPKGAYHQFTVTGNEEDYGRIVLGFDEVPELDDIISTRMDTVKLLRSNEINRLFEKLRDLFDHPLDEAAERVMVKSLFGELLVEIGRHDEKYEYRETSIMQFSSVTDEALSFIERNLDGNLTLHIIATSLHVSDSYLAHTFKKDMQIPIHRYILQKRLILANTLLVSDTAATLAASLSGFTDYSGFFRQYKKMFGFSPHDTKKKR